MQASQLRATVTSDQSIEINPTPSFVVKVTVQLEQSGAPVHKEKGGSFFADTLGGAPACLLLQRPPLQAELDGAAQAAATSASTASSPSFRCKLFVNVCSSDSVPAPRSEVACEGVTKGLRVPVSVGPLRGGAVTGEETLCHKIAFKDAAGNPCLVCDVVVHPRATAEATNASAARRALASLALAAVAAKHKLAPQGEPSFPRLRYKGGHVATQRIRRVCAGVEELDGDDVCPKGTAGRNFLVAAADAALDVRLLPPDAESAGLLGGIASSGLHDHRREIFEAEQAAGGAAALVVAATSCLRPSGDAATAAAARLRACSRLPVEAVLALPPLPAVMDSADNALPVVLSRIAAPLPPARGSPPAALESWLTSLPGDFELRAPRSAAAKPELVLLVRWPYVSFREEPGNEPTLPPPSLTDAAAAGVRVTLSACGRTLRVAPPTGHASLCVALPWPAEAAAAPFLDTSARSLTLRLRRLGNAPHPSEAAVAEAAAAATAAATGCGPVLTADSLQCLVEAGAGAAGASALAPEPGSRPWLLARTLAGVEAASSATAAPSPQQAAQAPYEEDAEDRFLRADALSAHFLQLRAEEAAAAAARVAEAAAETRAAKDAAAMAAARREVAATRFAAAATTAATATTVECPTR